MNDKENNLDAPRRVKTRKRSKRMERGNFFSKTNSAIIFQADMCSTTDDESERLRKFLNLE